jgi:hypothetical protein
MPISAANIALLLLQKRRGLTVVLALAVFELDARQSVGPEPFIGAGNKSDDGAAFKHVCPRRDSGLIYQSNAYYRQEALFGA